MINETLIKRMAKIGYHYDDNNSYKGYYAFTYSGMMLPMSFKTQKEIKEYLKYVVID